MSIVSLDFAKLDLLSKIIEVGTDILDAIYVLSKPNWSLYHVTRLTTRIPPYFGGRCEGWQCESSTYLLTACVTVSSCCYTRLQYLILQF